MPAIARPTDRSPDRPPTTATPEAAAESSLWQRRVLSEDLDAHARTQPGWALHYEQLSPGRFSGLTHLVQLPMARLVLERCSVAVRQRGAMGASSFGFALALGDGAAAAAPVIFNGQRVARDGLMLGRNRDELDLCTPPGFGLIAVVVDEALLEPLWQSLYGRPPSHWMQAQLVVPARAAVADALRSCHLRAMADAGRLIDAAGTGGPALEGQHLERAALQLRDALLIEWLEALPPSVDASALPTAQARKRLVDRACALMLAAPDEPRSMLQVCREVGASRRKLNACFQEVLGTSPVKYLRALRLNGVRRALRDAEPGTLGVQEAAARWGFWHMGQFSRDYRLQFGERPSQTLRQALQPQGTAAAPAAGCLPG